MKIELTRDQLLDTISAIEGRVDQCARRVDLSMSRETADFWEEQGRKAMALAQFLREQDLGA